MSDDRWLDDLLATPAPHLDDDGFTARVVAGLPRRRTGVARAVVLGVATVLAALVAAVTPARAGFMALGDLVQAIFGYAQSVAAGHSAPQASLVAPMAIAGAVVLVLLVWGAVSLARAQEA